MGTFCDEQSERKRKSKREKIDNLEQESNNGVQRHDEIGDDKININTTEKVSQTSRTQNTEEMKKSNTNITKETSFLLDIEDKVFPEGEHYYQLVKDTNISDL